MSNLLYGRPIASFLKTYCVAYPQTLTNRHRGLAKFCLGATGVIWLRAAIRKEPRVTSTTR